MLSHRIRVARRQAGLSQQALADRLGLSRAAVGNWESTSACCPSTEHLAGIASVAQVSFEWLATGRGAMRLEAGAASDVAAIVVCPNELDLLEAYRRAPDPVKRLLQDLALLRVVPGRGRPARSLG